MKKYKRVNELLGTNYKSDQDINWDVICRCYKLSEDFMREFKDKLDWYELSINQSFSESFIEEFKKRVDWDFISVHQKLSEDFIRKHKDRLNLKWISGSQKLSEGFIEEFKSYLDWERISAYQSLSEKFIIDHKGLVNWNIISRCQLLSTEFIIKFIDLVCLYSIPRCQPFLDLNNDKLRSIIDKESLERNDLYQLYQETKERGWFIGYIFCNSNHFSIKPQLLVDYNIKSRIYWKDLDLISRTKSYESIRLVKEL